MSPAHIDRVFGRGRLKMVTGEHVEVYREEAQPGERRRYTKRFLSTSQGDFRHWTEREWRILARLIGHGIGPVPDVVQFDRGASDRPALVQTYDAGVTVDHWATLPVVRDGRLLHHVFEDCAHWWALAKHCLIALDAIHELRLVHLDLKPDNVCIPLGPADFDPSVPGQLLYPRFPQIALIDFAFSLVSGEPLGIALPIGHQGDCDYQSPRLLRALEAGRRGDLMPTRELDWRCDMFSLAAMLRRHLPCPDGGSAGAWTYWRLNDAQTLVDRLFDSHHGRATAQRPHRELIELASAALRDSRLASSLERGWRLAGDADVAAHTATPTPATRIASPIIVPSARGGGRRGGPVPQPEAAARVPDAAGAAPAGGRPSERMRSLLWVSGALAAGALSVPLLAPGWLALRDDHLARVVASRAPSAIPQAIRVKPVEEPTDGVPVDEAAPASASSTSTVSGPAAAVQTSKGTPMPRTNSVPKAAPAPKAAAPRKPATSPKLAAAASKTTAPPRVATSRRPAPAARPAPAPTLGTISVAGASRPRTVAAIPAAPAAPRATMPASSPSEMPQAQAKAQTQASDESPATLQLPEEFAARARVLMDDHLPRIAQRAERLILRVLHLAAMADSEMQDAEVASAASAARLPADSALPVVAAAEADARRLDNAAAAAFWNGRNAEHALRLQTRAFGAHPHDAQIAGTLAFYHLKQRPAQAETARRLALYAIAVGNPQFPAGRIEDWTTLAIASALSGRERDARNALFVTLSLAPALDRPCRAAVAAYLSHGERLRAPTEAMLRRINASGRSQESTVCRWPPNWSASK